MGKGKLVREAVERLVRALDSGAEVTPRMRAQAGVEGRILEDLRVNNGRGVTNEMMRDADQFIIDEFYDMPLDQASRMQRADEFFPGEGYHYTDSKVDYPWVEPSRGDGFHVGTPEAANDRMFDAVHRGYAPYKSYGLVDETDVSNMRDYIERLDIKGETPGPRIMPMRIDPGRGIESNVDVGNWVDPSSLADLPYREGSSLGDSVDLVQWDNMTRRAGVARDAVDYQLTDDDLAAMFLEHNGLPVPSDIPRGNGDLVRWAEERQFLTSNALDTFAADVIARMTRQSVLDVMNNHGIDSIHYMNKHEGIPGTYSTMVTRPEQVRSVNARFDPRLRHLKHLMAGGAGAAVLPYSIADER